MTFDFDDQYVRPIRCRYLDPLDLVWIATCKRLGLHVRRDPSIFSMTDGTGLLALGPRADLDPDDTLAQMVFHEICHWLAAGRESFELRDWGFDLEPHVDVRELAALRVQAALADRFSLRTQFAPTGFYRQYYDRLGDDPMPALDDSAQETEAETLGRRALALADTKPWAEPLTAALGATSAMRELSDGFLIDYATEVQDDPLPSWWAPSVIGG